MLRERATAGRRPIAVAAAAFSAFAFLFTAVPAAATVGPVPPLRASEVSPPADAHNPQGTGLYSVSCTASGDCVAGGNYEDASGSVQPMVAEQVHGSWWRGTRLLLPAGAPQQPYAQINGIACSAPGECVAVGNYTYNAAHDVNAFLVTESRGIWSRASTPLLPGGAATPARARLETVTCLPGGFCEAAGSYQDTTGRIQGMALSKPPGRPWERATGITAPAGAAVAPDAVLTGVSCTGPGSCVAVGHYSVGPTASRGMGAVQISGSWHQAVGIPAPPGSVASSFTGITSVSCMLGGSCLGVGAFAVTPDRDRAMSVIESHGVFGTATAVTAAPAAASATPSTALSSVSCPPGGPCVATGVATNAARHYVAMYAVRTGSGWRAVFPAGPANVSTGKSQQSSLFSVSCTAGGHCTAVGSYNDATGGYSAGGASTG